MTSVTEEDLHQRMLAGIGRVAMNSGHASMALQQLAETVTGTGLLYFILRDATLGTQLKQVQTLVEYATTNEWIRHPPLDAEVRDLVLGTLKATKPLVEFRNRVIHDIWAPAPAEQMASARSAQLGGARSRCRAPSAPFTRSQPPSSSLRVPWGPQSVHLRTWRS